MPTILAAKLAALKVGSCVSSMVVYDVCLFDQQ